MTDKSHFVRVAFFLLVTTLATSANAEIVIDVSQPNIEGQKAVVKLDFKNEFSEEIKSARASIFLMDDQGKMVGNATRWIVGDKASKEGIATGSTKAFYFVVPINKNLTSTNLSAKVSVSRIVLANGEQPDVSKEAIIRSK